MATTNPTTAPVGPDTLITVKLIYEGTNRRFKLALRDLGANLLPQKLRFLLAIPPEVEVQFDRFSDSAGAYVTLDSNNPSIYKQLYRAAKAKLKLRLRATVIKSPSTETQTASTLEEQAQPKGDTGHPTTSTQVPGEPRQSYLDTVLSHPPRSITTAPSFKAFQTSRPVIASSTAIASHNATNETLVPTAQNQKVLESLSKPTLPNFHDFPSGAFSIDCNHCSKSIPNEHYHCSICEKGDFDLCQTCVDQGITCDGENHWLIKRSIQAGEVIPSVTETLAPRTCKSNKEIIEPVKEAPSAPVNTFKVFAERTCNSCISEFSESELVTCKDCPDFDLCHACFQYGEHGHHPAHTFQPVDEDSYTPTTIQALLEAGRGTVHDAICDGCDKHIIGVRHKCLNCPDWDYCSACILSADLIHPGHRFVPLYEPIASVTLSRTENHYGIHCDGPLCVNRNPKQYIRGIRYKCAVCHDTDFCANCEALPTIPHNKTHPLIKFRTHVRHVSVTTLSETGNGEKPTQMGDKIPLAKNAATETLAPASSANAATQVQTVAEVKPAEILLSEFSTPEATENSKSATVDLQAWFESDSTPDGTRFGPNRLVSQSWTLRNPGPQAWPAGCAVYYIGGDDMRNLDANHPSSVSVMTTANRSNVLDQSLEPDQTAVFQVLLKSPPREGRVISYWRLKTPEGIPFGHKLWVDITVTTTVTEPEIATDAPSVASTDQAHSQLEDSQILTEESSTMIFPKLEKESPSSSIHEHNEAAPVVAAVEKSEEQELLEDIESLELDDEETDDGFMTDEEYDILDASDEDFLVESQQAVNKK